MNVVILATYDKIFTTDLYCRENEAISNIFFRTLSSYNFARFHYFQDLDRSSTFYLLSLFILVSQNRFQDG